jgi:acyl-coenzyme A synthetase/AMP-(fatty) acid ligase
MTMIYTNDAHLCQEDRVCFAISITRIGGVWQTLLALLNGAALFPFDVRHEGVAKLADWLAQEELTTILFAPSVFRQLVATLTGAGNFQNLRLLHISGEAVYATDFELYRKYFAEHCIFTSGLGTTEIIPVRLIFGDKTTKITGRTVPVGYPVEGVEVFLLDDAGEDVGDGEVGEIAVKSRYLAQGYWNDPGLTRIKFRQDRDGKDERIYLTGDLGRILPEGCLIHLGRKDFQVKIRGYKVILGEVEAALCDIDEINEAAVVDRTDRLGNSRLVAYVTTATQPAPSISDLRRALSQKLLDYMVPSTFVIKKVEGTM